VRILRLLLFLLVLALLSAAPALADPSQAVPPGCSSGAWVLTDSNAGVPGHRWYDYLYPTTGRENEFGAGWKFSPCWPMFSTQNGYGIGWDGVSGP
jgi:hypothetical protein